MGGGARPREACWGGPRGCESCAGEGEGSAALAALHDEGTVDAQHPEAKVEDRVDAAAVEAALDKLHNPPEMFGFVAATKVECLVLGRKEMEWAITGARAAADAAVRAARRMRKWFDMACLAGRL